MAPPSDHTDRHLQKLAALITQRRVALGLTNKEAGAARCGLSPMTYRKIEGGERVTDTSYAKLEIGYGFRPGACREVLDGADSITLEDGTELIEGGQIRDHVDPARLAEVTPGALTKSASLHAPELTLGQIESIAGGFMEELRRLGVVPKED
ncbi:hypothetical protein [Streptomyces alboflavus]